MIIEVKSQSFTCIPFAFFNAEKSQKAPKKVETAVKVMQSATPSVYVCEPLDPNVDYSRWGGKADRLFSLNREYVSPTNLNYELPTAGKPEFAFIGRSNVGKSSLVGALLGNRNLVRISRNPGCTKAVNYFKFATRKGSAECYFIDLPGYGFARSSKSDRAKWSKTIKTFLENRSHIILRRVYILIDSRHPIKESDVDMMNLLNECELSFQIILTKADISSATEKIICLQSAFQEMMSKRHACGFPIVHIVSSSDGSGLEALKHSIAEIVYGDSIDID